MPIALCYGCVSAQCIGAEQFVILSLCLPLNLPSARLTVRPRSALHFALQSSSGEADAVDRLIDGVRLEVEPAAAAVVAAVGTAVARAVQSSSPRWSS